MCAKIALHNCVMNNDMVCIYNCILAEVDVYRIYAAKCYDYSVLILSLSMTYDSGSMKRQ